MATNTASARSARRNPTVTVRDMETGALIRVSSVRGEIARRLSVVDEQEANGALTASHARKARARLRTMERVAFGGSDKMPDEVVTDDDNALTEAWAERTRSRMDYALADYEGVWTDDMVGAFTASL